MNQAEANKQTERLVKYDTLRAERKRVQATRDAITEPWPNGPHGQGPFTGNTRESRRVNAVSIEFSKTLGGAEPVSMTLNNLGIEAYELRNFLLDRLDSRIEALDNEIEAL